MSQPTPALPFTGTTPLLRQISAVRSLALYGTHDVARELCASIFLKQSHALAATDEPWLGFVECTLLLGMKNLLARLLRATHGAGVSASTSGPSGERLHLTFSNGSSLLIPSLRPDLGMTARAEHVAYWSERILAAARQAQSGLQLPLELAGADPQGGTSTLSAADAQPAHAMIA